MDRRILIYVSTAQDGVLATKVLGAASISTQVCNSLPTLLAELARGCGALMVAEEVITGAALHPLKAFVHAQPPWSDLPILVLTARGSDSLDAQRAYESLGNVTLIERPVRTIGLISAVRSALRARERQYQVWLADQRKDEFLATLAHELRNPLAPIRTTMSIIARQQPGPEVERLVGIVERQVSHLTRLVDDLLDVARITTGKVALRMERTTVRAVLTHVLEICSHAVAEKRHTLEVHQPMEDCTIEADHARIVQSFANLLGNAAKFTPAGGHIRVSAEVQGQTLRFAVRDSGRGMTPQAIARIFELFAQASSPDEPASGLGIGLHLARRFAEMHGGSIEASSAGPDKGSEFVILLPVVVAQETPCAPASAPEPPTVHGDARKILVVDDNADAAITLQALLEIEGYEATIAYDGREAVAAVADDPPDVVLMDIGMPRMDGYQAARLIRAQGVGVKLVALTGWGQELDRQRAENAGFDMHFVKPVDLQKLLHYLDTLNAAARPAASAATADAASAGAGMAAGLPH